MGDVTKVRIGACSVKFGANDLGHTKGGVVVEYNPKYEDITVDLYGDTPIDKVLVSEGLTAKVKLAESSMENLNRVIAPSTLTTSGGDKMVKVGKQAGYLLSNKALQLVLHPLDKSATDLSDDVTFYKAVVAESVALNYEVDKERIFEVTFVALIDTSKSDGNLLGHLGTHIS